MAPSPSGKAEVCKTSITGSNPVGASRVGIRHEMTHTPADPSTNPSLIGQFFNAALAGLAAGVLAALLDTRQAAGVLNQHSDIGLLLLQAIGRLGMAGAVLGLTASVLTESGSALAARLGRSRQIGATGLLTMVATPALIYIAFSLFQGGTTSKLPARHLFVAATAAASIAMTFVVARMTLSLVDSADQTGSKKSRLFIVAGILFLIALGIRWCDAHLYRRLYLYLHAALGLTTIGGLGLAFRICILSNNRDVRRSRLAPITLGAVLVVFAVALGTSDKRQNVKTAAWESTATLSNLLRITSVSQRVRRNQAPSDKVRELRRQRARRGRELASDDWPVFPNAHVLLITIDALRADRLGVYGNTRRKLSPNIDRWAEERGVVFERAYCTAPHSSFSITSLHTSRYTHDEAMLKQEIRHATLAEILGDYGYQTVAFYTQGIFFTDGDQVGHYRRSEFGFDTATHGSFDSTELTDKAIEAIDVATANSARPVFIWVHYFNVHEPYKSERFGTSPADRYEGEIYETDAEVIRLIKHAEQTLRGEKIVFLSADHGEEFKDHGGYYHGSSLYEEQVRVPLIVSLPRAVPHRVTTPVSLTGVAPTALKLVGILPPAHMLGQDLRPALLSGGRKHLPQPVFASVMHHHMVIRWPWKLIADPSRQLYELYNLTTDPLERVNVYDREQTTADELLDEIHGWLDDIGKGEDEARTALNLGQMSDPRAIPGLKSVAANSGAPTAERVEAIRLLGKMRDHSTIPALTPLLDDRDEHVAIAAALSLGRLGDRSGQDLMRDALFDDYPSIRDQAALVLGRLGDSAAAPALIEALGRDDVDTREQAVRMLGRLGDPTTVEPLLEALDEERIRYLVVLALGKIGNLKAYDALMNVLEHDRYTDVRGYAVVALGWLEADQAAPKLIRVLREEPEIKWTAESLIRLGAVGRAPLFGTDIAEGLPGLLGGFSRCTEKPKIVHGEFMGRTTCRTKGHIAKLSFEASAPNGATVILRARHLLSDKGLEPVLTIRVDEREVAKVHLHGELEELRIDTPAWSPGGHGVVLQLEKSGRFEVDHLLVLAK